MSFLLKIVEGPNKGAEVALVEGVAVTLGKGDECDIVVADSTMPDAPLSVEAGEDGVAVGGEPLEPFHVKTVGATSFAVGPADAPWGELKWPEREPAKPDGRDGKEAKPDEAASVTPRPAAEEPAPEEDAPAEKPRRHGCMGCLLMILLAALVLAALCWFFRDRAKEYGEYGKAGYAKVSEKCRSWWERWRAGAADGQCAAGESGEGVAVQAVVSLKDIADKYGLSLSDSATGEKLVGNLKTRRERLSATAEAYAVKPGVDIDVTDDESMRASAEDALFLLTEGALKVSVATNRVVGIVGDAPSVDALKRTLQALNADMPKIAGVDVSGVRFSNVVAWSEPKDDAEESAPAAPSAARRTSRKKANALPSLPVCGILTTPYPCLISRDGRRYLEGAEIGGSVILKIAADSVTLTNSTGRFTWKP